MLRKDIVVISLLLSTLLIVGAFYGWYLFQQDIQKVGGSQRTYEDFQVVVEYLPESYDVRTQDLAAQHVFFNVYEGLTKIDGLYRVGPGLAYTWGNTDDQGLWWEFKLRSGVRFHNGEMLTEDHVRQSFAWYLESESDSMKFLTASIDTVEVDPGVVRIKTKYPDPLLLYRLHFLFMLPLDKEAIVQLPVGTGPFRIEEKSPSRIDLEINEDYWGELPAIKHATFAVIADVYDREDALFADTIDVLFAVPGNRNFLDRVRESSVLSLLQQPSLELVYIALNVGEFIGRQRNVLFDSEIREALLRSIDTSALASIPQFGRVATQFVASGVFGYDIERTYTLLDRAITERLLGERYVTVNLALPTSFELIGQAIAAQLEPLQITVNLELYDDPEEFLDGIREQRFQMYLVGTKYDLADGGEFFRSVVHSQQDAYGQLNGMGYSDVEIDDQIQRSERLLDEQERLEVLKGIQTDVMNDWIGLPVFELDRVMVKKNSLDWKPRMDGIMVLSEVR